MGWFLFKLNPALETNSFPQLYWFSLTILLHQANSDSRPPTFSGCWTWNKLFEHKWYDQHSTWLTFAIIPDVPRSVRLAREALFLLSILESMSGLAFQGDPAWGWVDGSHCVLDERWRLAYLIWTEKKTHKLWFTDRIFGRCGID